MLYFMALWWSSFHLINRSYVGYLVMAASPMKQSENGGLNAVSYLQVLPLIHMWQTTKICLDFIVWIHTEMCSHSCFFKTLASSTHLRSERSRACVILEHFRTSVTMQPLISAALIEKNKTKQMN